MKKMNNNYYEDPKFDRKAKCDWCGRKKTVAVCHYGTTHYNRLVCPTCAKNINEHEHIFGHTNYFNPEKLKEV
jgi:hypothetical protein